MNATTKILALEVVENGTHYSLMGDDGYIWATGRGMKSMLREAGMRAKRAGYESIVIDHQRWDCDRLCEI